MSTSSNPLAAGVPALQPPKPTQAMITPTGEVSDVPVENVAAAVKGGYKMGIDMNAPDGHIHTIPVDRAHDAVAKGYMPTGSSPAAGQAMETSAAPKVVRAVTGALPAAGAIVGGALATPETVGAGTAVGVGLGAAAGKSAELGINNAIFGKDEPSNISAEGLKQTAETGAIAGATEGAFQALPGVASKAGELGEKLLQGRGVASAPAEAALRSAGGAAAEDAGVASQVTFNPKAGIRTVLDEPIQVLAKNERAAYDTVNQAAETDMKTLYDSREEIQDAIDDPTNIGQKSALQKELSTVQAQIAQGEAKVQSKLGADAPKLIQDAKAMTQQRYSMQAGKQKLFNNESVVEGNAKYGAKETIKTDAAIRNAESLNKPSRYAPEGSPTRLQQMLGEKGADALLQGLYDAKEDGVQAMKVQTYAKLLGKGLAWARVLTHGI